MVPAVPVPPTSNEERGLNRTLRVTSPLIASMGKGSTNPDALPTFQNEDQGVHKGQIEPATPVGVPEGVPEVPNIILRCWSVSSLEIKQDYIVGQSFICTTLN